MDCSRGTYIVIISYGSFLYHHTNTKQRTFVSTERCNGFFHSLFHLAKLLHNYELQLHTMNRDLCTSLTSDLTTYCTYELCTVNANKVTVKEIFTIRMD